MCRKNPNGRCRRCGAQQNETDFPQQNSSAGTNSFWPHFCRPRGKGGAACSCRRTAR